MAVMVNANDLRKGMILEFDDAPSELTSLEHFKLGKGNSEARIRLKLKNLRTGSVSEKVYQTSDHFRRMVVESREAQYLYTDGDFFHFMDTANFEQFAFTKDQLADFLPYLKEGMKVETLTNNGIPIVVHPPRTAELKVVQTGPSFKGDTAASGTKPATLETGVSVGVPFFINNGDVIRVDTSTGKYLERV